MLRRAEKDAQEHASLTQRLANDFDTASAKRVGVLSRVADAYNSWKKASDSLQELDVLLKDASTDEELRKLAVEDSANANEQLQEASRTLTKALLPRHPFAHLPCLIEIKPGVGGQEAALFAADLLRMYQAFCLRRGLRAKLMHFEDQEGVSDPNGSDAPLQEATLEVTSPEAYDILRTEAGVHRVQRVPATESKGRTHTSAANVLVMPSMPSTESGNDDLNDPNSDYYVSPTDVKTDTMRSGGAGGQHVNKTESGVRLTHTPTDTVVKCQESRSQLQNRATAWQILRSRIAQQKRDAREIEMLKFRRSTTGHGKFGRGDKIRTYNWSQQRVTDHRSGLTINQLDDVIDGGAALDSVMDSVRAWMLEEEIQALVAESS